MLYSKSSPHHCFSVRQNTINLDIEVVFDISHLKIQNCPIQVYSVTMTGFKSDSAEAGYK